MIHVYRLNNLICIISAFTPCNCNFHIGGCDVNDTSSLTPEPDFLLPVSSEGDNVMPLQSEDAELSPEDDDFINIWANDLFQTDKKVWNIHDPPFTLPSDLTWSVLDLTDSTILNELSILLNENSLDLEGPRYQNQYNIEFIKWAIQTPEALRDWHLGIRSKKDGELLGFISATPRVLRFYETLKRIVEIKLFRIHKTLRGLNITAIIISEIIRRIQNAGIFQTICTSNSLKAKPIVSCDVYFCPLNAVKLINVSIILFLFLYSSIIIHLNIFYQLNFAETFRDRGLTEKIVYQQFPNKQYHKGFRRIEEEDMMKAYILLKKYLQTFHICSGFCFEDFKHWFTPRKNVIECYVLEDEDNNITDMSSFYYVKSVVLEQPSKNIVKAYSFYNVCTKTPWEEMLYDTLIAAKNTGVDVFYALDTMDNWKFLHLLNFQPTGESQQYYINNWRYSPIGQEGIGMISV